MALNFIKARTKPCILGPILPRRAQKNFFKHQLHSTHVGAVGLEPHGSFATGTRNKRLNKLHKKVLYKMALNFIKARTKPCILGPILPRRAQKNFFKHQLHSTHVGAVGLEPHGSFPTGTRNKSTRSHNN